MSEAIESQPHSWGAYCKHLRIHRAGKTLREFCLQHEFDAGNMSKYERGVLFAPQDPVVLEGIARALGLAAGSEEWVRYFDLAALDHGKIPQDIMDDQAVVGMLPVLLRTVHRSKLSESDLLRLIEVIRSSEGQQSHVTVKRTETGSSTAS